LIFCEQLIRGALALAPNEHDKKVYFIVCDTMSADVGNILPSTHHHHHHHHDQEDILNSCELFVDAKRFFIDLWTDINNQSTIVKLAANKTFEFKMTVKIKCSPIDGATNRSREKCAHKPKILSHTHAPNQCHPSYSLSID
jgi:hypothetical protein